MECVESRSRAIHHIVLHECVPLLERGAGQYRFDFAGPGLKQVVLLFEALSVVDGVVCASAILSDFAPLSALGGGFVPQPPHYPVALMARKKPTYV